MGCLKNRGEIFESWIDIWEFYEPSEIPVNPCLPTRPQRPRVKFRYQIVRERRESAAGLEPQRKSFFSAEKVGAAVVLQIEFLSNHEQSESKVRGLSSRSIDADPTGVVPTGCRVGQAFRLLNYTARRNDFTALHLGEKLSVCRRWLFRC